MSKKYNQAGTSLVVDEIIELKGYKKTDTKVSQQQLQAELLKRDTSKIQRLLADISSDSKITPEEKIILEREWKSIVASNIIIQGIVETKHMDEYVIVETYNIAYQALDAFLTPILQNMKTTSTVSSTELNNKFSNLYQARSIVEEMSFRLTTGMLEGYDFREKFEVNISSTTGVTVLLDGTQSTLSVTLLHNGEDVTANYPEDSFKWVRVTEERGLDLIWGEKTGKVLAVSKSDLVNKGATFMCKFTYYYTDTMYYAKVGIIGISLEVPGPPGIDAIYVVPQNGNLFRFDDHLRSHKGISPTTESGGTLFPDGGLFGGAVGIMESAIWLNIANNTWEDLA